MPTDFRVIQWDASERELWIECQDETLGIHVNRGGGRNPPWRCRQCQVRCQSISAQGTSTLADHTRAVAGRSRRVSPGLTNYAGRWGRGEMRRDTPPYRARTLLDSGSRIRAKAGFERRQLAHDSTDPEKGEVLGAHIAWSGDYATRIEVRRAKARAMAAGPVLPNGGLAEDATGVRPHGEEPTASLVRQCSHWHRTLPDGAEIIPDLPLADR